ncbi:MAG: hypothetical protein ABSA93_10615 [Streptosporangiaceae bacterium]|jgi:hypothetical protein
MTEHDDDAIAHEDALLTELIPQAAEDLAARYAREHDAGAGKARFDAWLAEHTETQRPPRRWLPPWRWPHLTIMLPAAIGMACAILAVVAILEVVANLSYPSPMSDTAPQGQSGSMFYPDPPRPPTWYPTPITTPAAAAGTLYTEVTDNHLGTDVFQDPEGDAVTSGPAAIPYGTRVGVKCWAPNESGMGSINAFYLLETPPWKGDFAPANTFLNADTAGSIDPNVPECRTP